MGTSRPVIRKARPLPGNPARSELPNWCVSASLGKPESFAHARHWTCTSQRSKRTTIAELHPGCRRAFRRSMAFPKAPGAALAPLRASKLYGIPTVFSAPSLLQSSPLLRTRPKTRFLRRAREGIPWPLFEFALMQMPPPGPDGISNSTISRPLMVQSWRVEGESLFGGTGTTMPADVQSDPMCGRQVVTFGNKRVSKPWPPSTITVRRLS